MTEIILVEEAPEGGCTARAPGESIHTEADTLEELKEMVRDAVRAHFDPAEAPSVIRQHHVTIPAHRLLRAGTLSAILSDVAQYAGVSSEMLVAQRFG